MTPGFSLAQDTLAAVRELRSGTADVRPVVVSGHYGLATMLRRELVRGGEEGAVREGGPVDGAAALVYVLAENADAGDVESLREAVRVGVPSVAVIVGPEGKAVGNPPYVLASRVIRVSSGAGFPVDEIAGALARSLGDRGSRLAARLPILRAAVVDEAVRRYSRRNAAVATVGGRARATMALLTLDQVRLVLRIADAHGLAIDRERAPEILGVVAGGFGFRGAARAAARLFPFAHWAVRGGVAYGGTRAIGEAAKRYFAARTS